MEPKLTTWPLCAAFIWQNAVAEPKRTPCGVKGWTLRGNLEVYVNFGVHVRKRQSVRAGGPQNPRAIDWRLRRLERATALRASHWGNLLTSPTTLSHSLDFVTLSCRGIKRSLTACLLE